MPDVMSKFSWDCIRLVPFKLSGLRRRTLWNDLEPALGTSLHLRVVTCGAGAIVGVLTLCTGRSLSALRSAVHIALHITARRRIVVGRSIGVSRIAGIVAAGIVGVGVRVARVVRVPCIVGIAESEPPKTRKPYSNCEVGPAVVTTPVIAAATGVASAAMIGATHRSAHRSTHMPTTAVLCERGSAADGESERRHYCQSDSFHDNLLGNAILDLTHKPKFGLTIPLYNSAESIEM